MSGGVAAVAVHGVVGEAAPSDFTIEVVRDLSALEAVWRRLEDRATATPYQRHDWVRCFAGANVEPGAEIRVAAIRDGLGRAVMLLPLSVVRRFGVSVASFVGGKHANFAMPVTCRGLAASLTAERQRSLLVAAGRSLGVDAFAFDYVPRTWDGMPVALASLGHPSPSDAYGVELDPDPAEALKRAMSPEGRRKLRNKENNLRKLGALAFTNARTPEEIEPILQTFFAQKSARFRDQGITDPFAGAAERFIRAACLAGLEAGRPAIELTALSVDGAVIAVFGAAADDRRVSGMFVSFDPAFGRYSPGDQLVARVIQDSAERGRTFFDLGVGEAEYKRRFCQERIPLVDVALPVTLKGRLFVAALSGAMSAKRRVKQSSRAMALVKGLRRWRSRLPV